MLQFVVQTKTLLCYKMSDQNRELTKPIWMVEVAMLSPAWCELEELGDYNMD